MKYFLTFIFLAIIALPCFSQSFEGTIVYSNKVKSKDATISDSQWTTMLGAKQEYLIKGANYRINANGTMFQWQLYVSTDNKLYNKLANSEVIFWNDGAVQGDEVLKSELKKNVTTVLGYACDEITLTCKSGIQKYYFNSKFAVNPALFAKHKFGNWYDFVSKAKALPLKSSIETAQFIAETTATEIKPGKLNESSFELPAGVKIEKSPY